MSNRCSVRPGAISGRRVRFYRNISDTAGFVQKESVEMISFIYKEVLTKP